MKLSIEQYQNYLKETEPTERLVRAKFELNTAGFEEMAGALIDNVQELLDEGRLGFSSYEVAAEPAVKFSLEMSPVNLPMTDFKKVNQFFQDETALVDMKIYLVTRSEFINVSKLHIDLLGDSDQDLSATDLAKMLSEKYDLIVETFKNPPAPKPVVKPAAKKATTKKTTTKKAATKKTATKKNAAKKLTTKKPTTKKATKVASKTTKKSTTKSTRKSATKKSAQED